MMITGNLRDLTHGELRSIAALALGRILRIGSRRFEEGDLEDYYDCVAIITEASCLLRGAPNSHRPSLVENRLKGAEGQW